MSTKSVAYLMKQRTAFGAIDIGRQLAQSMSDIYLSVFLLTVALLPAGAVSVMFLVGKIIDAVTDVVVGILVDHTKTRIGRSRPWLFAGGIVFASGLILMFQTPQFSVTGKVIYMYVAYIIFTVGLTMVNIPEGSLMALMTDDAHERTILGSIRGVGGTVGQSLLSLTVIGLVAFFGKGNEALGYSRTALFWAGIMLILVYFGAIVIRELSLPEVKSAEDIGHRGNTFVDLKAFFATKNFNMELLLCFGNLFMSISVMSTMVYYCRYVINNLAMVGIGITALSVTSLIPALIVPYLNKKMTKSNIICMGALICCAGILIRLLSVFSPSMIVVGMVIIGLGTGFIGTMLQATQPDVVDELTVKLKRMNTGLLMALFSLACQIGVGVASALVTFILGVGGFDGAADAQSTSATVAINIVFTCLPLIGTVLIFVAMFIYDLDNHYPEIKARLAEFRGGETPADAHSGSERA